MSARVPIVGGNWKMNLDLASGVDLAERVRAGCDDLAGSCEVAVFPAFPYLTAVGRALGDRVVTLGAQDVYHEPEGAYTGEVSTSMIEDVGATMVIVGHSERRHVIGEDDDLVNRKATAALAAGLSVILCVGETLEQREADRTRDVVVEQVRRGLAGIERGAISRLVIAYEPVWAIGTGRTATVSDAETVHRVIRRTIADLYDGAIADGTRIQYGGSVKPGNAADLFACDDIDGFLVGGESLKPDDFLAIIRSVAARPEGTTLEARVT